MIKKWIVRFISIGILFLFMFSASTAVKVKDHQNNVDFNQKIISSTLFPFSQNTFISSPSTSYFYNIGYDICESNGLIHSIGLCMESNIEAANSFYSTSVIVSSYDSDGILVREGIVTFDEGINVISPICSSKGNFIVCGGVIERMNGSIIAEYPILIKIDENFEIIWQKKFPSLPNAVGLSVAETNDDGYIVSGFMIENRGTDIEQNYLFLIKTDSNGKLVWKNSIEVDGWLYQRSVIQTEDDGFLIAGDFHPSREQITKSDILLVKTNDNGIVKWNKTMDFSSSDYASDLIIGPEGIILTGFVANQSHSGSWRYNGLLYCFDEAGDVLWSEFEQFENRAFYGIDTADDGYVLTGFNVENNSVLILKIDEDTQIVWEENMLQSDSCTGMDVTQTSKGSFCFTGFTIPSITDYPEFFYSEIITGCTDNLGNKQWMHTTVPITSLTCNYQKQKWIIKNTGIVGSYNLSVNVDVEGNVFKMIQSENEQILVVLPDEERMVNIPFLFGLGKVTLQLSITGVNIEPITETIDGFLFGPFFFNL